MMWLTMGITFLLAALSGMGVGGGGLFVIYLSLFTDTPQLVAQGMNLLFFLFFSQNSTLPPLFLRFMISKFQINAGGFLQPEGVGVGLIVLGLDRERNGCHSILGMVFVSDNGREHHMDTSKITVIISRSQETRDVSCVK